jgi:hypothetical protein
MIQLEDLKPDSVLRRSELAEALTARGFPTTIGTLANLAIRDSGPPFRKYGRIPIYRWDHALAWAEARAGELLQSTSEYRKPQRLSTEELVKQHEEVERRNEEMDAALKELGL